MQEELERDLEALNKEAYYCRELGKKLDKMLDTIGDLPAGTETTSYILNNILEIEILSNSITKFNDSIIKKIVEIQDNVHEGKYREVI